MVAQDPNVRTFELNTYEWTPGRSQTLELTLTVQNPTADRIEIKSGNRGCILVIEAIHVINPSGASTGLWLTRDNRLFEGRLPQTVWVSDRAEIAELRLAAPVTEGNRVVIKFGLTIDKNVTEPADRLSAKSLNPSENKLLSVSVSSVAKPGSELTYKAAKSITLKLTDNPR